MNDFEKKYYEAAGFWEEGALDNAANIERVKFTTDLIPIDTKSLIDVGCGNGLFGNYLLEKRPELDILCVDRSTTALAYVRSNKKIGDLLDIPADSDSFDCVTCLQVLEHIPVNVYGIGLKELSRVSKQYIIISVPYEEDIKKNSTECPSCHSIFNADLHLRTYNNEEIKRLFEPYGFECVSATNIVNSSQFIGIEIYNNLRRLGERKSNAFLSPICPICGFENDSFKAMPVASTAESSVVRPFVKKYYRKITRLFKTVWPKKEKAGYWIVALYKKKN